MYTAPLDDMQFLIDDVLDVGAERALHLLRRAVHRPLLQLGQQQHRAAGPHGRRCTRRARVSPLSWQTSLSSVSRGVRNIAIRYDIWCMWSAS